MTLPTSATSISATNACIKPFVYDEADSKSLHFTINELQSRMRISHPIELELAYTKTMMGFVVLNRHPRSIAMIGLGGGSLAKFCRHVLPQANFIAIEINPHVIALRNEFHIPKNSDLFRVIEADGAEYVHRVKGSLDVLLVDSYDYQGQPAELCSEKFYEGCREALTANGVLAVNFHEDHPRYETFIDRLATVFEGKVVEVSANKDGNVIVFASRDMKVSPPGLRTVIAANVEDWPAWLARNG